MGVCFCCNEQSTWREIPSQKEKSTVSILPINHSQVNFKIFKCVVTLPPIIMVQWNMGRISNCSDLNGTMIVVFFQRPFLRHCHLRPPRKKKNMVPALPLSMRDPLWLVPLEIPMANTQNQTWFWKVKFHLTQHKQQLDSRIFIDTYIILSYNALSCKGGFQPYCQ